jgi:hypothetical protein
MRCPLVAVSVVVEIFLLRVSHVLASLVAAKVMTKTRRIMPRI